MKIVFYLLVLFSVLITSCQNMSDSSFLPPESSSNKPSDTKKLPETFTTENIMKVRQGMRSEQILEMFGPPKNVSASVCGSGAGKWNCTKWEYGQFVYQYAAFTFSVEDSGVMILNDFKIKRK